ncbi:MFS transporter [Flavobacterium sp. RHBU_3]|uniref:MFS transporter n=1 Tax=Flavobacterium sp. RHBU_3 TaxID=3391184 RepID=UPI003984D01F
MTKTYQAQIVRRAVAAMFFMAGLCFSSWASRIATIQEKLSISEGQFGAVLFAMPVGLMLSLPVSGWGVSRFGSRKVVSVALAAYGISLIGLGFMPNMYLLALNIMVFGFCSNAVNVSVNAQAVATELLYRKPIMASFHGVWSLAGFIGGGIGTFMIGQQVPPFIHFILISIVTVGSVFICWRYLNDDKGSGEKKQSAFTKPDSALITLGLIAFCSMVVEGTMFDWTTIYFKKVVNAADAYAGLGFTAGMCMMATGRFVADGFSARFGLKRTLQLSGVLSLSGLAIAIAFPYLVPAIIGFMLIGAGISSVVPLVYSVAGRSTTMAPGPAIAAVSTISFLGFLIGPPIIGFLAEAFSLRVSFLFVALMALLVIVFTTRAKV